MARSEVLALGGNAHARHQQRRRVAAGAAAQADQILPSMNLALSWVGAAFQRGKQPVQISSRVATLRFWHITGRLGRMRWLDARRRQHGALSLRQPRKGRGQCDKGNTEEPMESLHESLTSQLPQQSPGCRQRKGSPTSALAGLDSAVGLVDDIDATLAAHEAVVTVPLR